ncbi:MAG: ABC transporter permease subunit [Bryobacteraceae bacterium]|nr:ABC transporter permease subunit [Bryobacteraceae bacterium]MDW8377877.1 ABC transporter permease subunit [Bryobacterales bacterium]
MAIDWFPLWLSLRVAALSTLCGLLFSLWAAYRLTFTSEASRNWARGLLSLLLVLPPTVLGYWILVAAGNESWLGATYLRLTGSPLLFSWQAAVLAASLHSTPWLLRATWAALDEVQDPYGRAALSLGASERRTFLRICLPLAARPVLAATILAFARALGEFGLTLMIAGNLPGRTQTLAVAVYDAVLSSRGEVARALVLVLSAGLLLLVWLASRAWPKQASG